MHQRLARWGRPLFALFVMGASFWLLTEVKALDTTNGDGVAFYGQSGNTNPRWRTYSSLNSFGGASNTAVGAVPLSARVKTSPIKQEAVAGYISSTGTLQIMCYNGTSWTNEWTVATGGTGSQGRFDIAFETTSGDVMVAYSTGAATTNELAYRTKPGSSDCGSGNWSAATNLDPLRTATAVAWVRLEASPVAGSNTIGMAWSDSASDLSAMQWTGASWAIAEPGTALEIELEFAAAAGDVLAFDLAYESLTGNLMIVWGVLDPSVACTAGTNCIRYARYASGSWGAATALPTVADSATSIDIAANPLSDQLAMAATDNRSQDLSVGYWSGTAWTGTANLDTSTSTPAAGQKLLAVSWLTAGATTRSIVAYADATATTTSISYYAGNAGTFAAQTDFAGTPVPGAFRWFDAEQDPINRDRLQLTLSDANSDLFSKRLVMTAAPAFSWTNADGGAALETTLGQATSRPFSFAYWRYVPTPAAMQGDGQLAYAESGVFTPRNRAFYQTNTSWSAESSLPTNTSASQATVMRAASTRNEYIAGFVNASGVLNVYRYNGTSWSSEWTATTGTLNTPRFDIAYEQLSGDAMVVYSANVGSTNELLYRMWNGSSWSSPTSYDATRTSGVVHFVVAKARPGTDEIGVAWADANRALSGSYWSGSAWVGEPAAALEVDLAQINGGLATPHSPVFDLAFEEQTGRLMVGWGENLTVNFKYVLRSAGSGGTWGSPVSPAGFTAQATIMKLASRPNSNDIAFVTRSNYNAVTATNAQAVQAAAWNGSTWTVSSSYSPGGSIVEGEFDVGVDWVESGGTARAVFVIDVSASTAVDYFHYDKTANNFSSVSTFAGAQAPDGTDDKTVRVIRNPYNAAEAMVLIVDSLDDLTAKKVSFNGSAFTWTSIEPLSAPLEQSVQAPAAIDGWSVAYAYRQFFAGSTLAVDIVDASGASVASPALSLNTTLASSDCQVTVGTFGVSAQKIRLTNTTVTPGWTLSIAATGGAASNWTSGTANYDFNDPSGSPSGCGDGGDTDSLAGQLAVESSTGTLTPQGGCSASGISAGSSNAFSQDTTDNITMLSASGAQTGCYWDLTGVSVSQAIPAFQPAGSYAISMTLTVVAN